MKKSSLVAFILQLIAVPVFAYATRVGVNIPAGVTGPGSVPIGGMVAVMPNTHANAWQPPASGQIKDGFMRADGATVPACSDCVIPAGQVLPNMNAKYPRGNTTSGTAGGSNTYTPAGTVSQPSFTGTATSYTVSVPAHYHSNGTGSTLTAGSAGDHSHGISSTFTSLVGAKGGGATDITYGAGSLAFGLGTIVSGGAHTHTVTGTIGLVTGGQNGNAAFGASGTNTPSGSVSQPSFTGTSGNNEPAYLEVVWVIRVK
jgi:hypothetical protein